MFNLTPPSHPQPQDLTLFPILRVSTQGQLRFSVSPAEVIPLLPAHSKHAAPANRAVCLFLHSPGNGTFRKNPSPQSRDVIKPLSPALLALDLTHTIVFTKITPASSGLHCFNSFKSTQEQLSKWPSLASSPPSWRSPLPLRRKVRLVFRRPRAVCCVSKACSTILIVSAHSTVAGHLRRWSPDLRDDVLRWICGCVPVRERGVYSYWYGASFRGDMCCVAPDGQYRAIIPTLRADPRTCTGDQVMLTFFSQVPSTQLLQPPFLPSSSPSRSPRPRLLWLPPSPRLIRRCLCR